MTDATREQNAGSTGLTAHMFAKQLRAKRFTADDSVLEFLRSCGAASAPITVRLDGAEVTGDTIRRRVRGACRKAGLDVVHQNAPEDSLRFLPAPVERNEEETLHDGFLQRMFVLAGYLFWLLDAVQAASLARSWANGDFIQALDSAVWWLVMFAFVFAVGFVFWRLGQEAARAVTMQRLFGFLYIIIAALMLGAVSFHFIMYRDYGLLTHVGYIVLVSFVALLGYGLCLASRWTPRWLGVPFLLVLLSQVVIVTYQAMTGQLLVAGKGLGGTFLLVVACATDALLLYDPEYVFAQLRKLGLMDVTSEVRGKLGELQGTDRTM